MTLASTFERVKHLHIVRICLSEDRIDQAHFSSTFCFSIIHSYNTIHAYNTIQYHIQLTFCLFIIHACNTMFHFLAVSPILYKFAIFVFLTKIFHVYFLYTIMHLWYSYKLCLCDILYFITCFWNAISRRLPQI